jgi:hypothetical protein
MQMMQNFTYILVYCRLPRGESIVLDDFLAHNPHDIVWFYLVNTYGLISEVTHLKICQYHVVFPLFRKTAQLNPRSVRQENH